MFNTTKHKNIVLTTHIDQSSCTHSTWTKSLESQFPASSWEAPQYSTTAHCTFFYNAQLQFAWPENVNHNATLWTPHHGLGMTTLTLTLTLTSHLSYRTGKHWPQSNPLKTTSWFGNNYYFNFNIRFDKFLFLLNQINSYRSSIWTKQSFQNELARVWNQNLE